MSSGISFNSERADTTTAAPVDLSEMLFGEHAMIGWQANLVQTSPSEDTVRITGYSFVCQLI
jgi:hypothetical protein